MKTHFSYFTWTHTTMCQVGVSVKAIIMGYVEIELTDEDERWADVGAEMLEMTETEAAFVMKANTIKDAEERVKEIKARK